MRCPCDGSLFWDVLGIHREVLAGAPRGRADRSLHGIGIDSWAVDYGLLDRDGPSCSATPTATATRRTDGVRGAGAPYRHGRGAVRRHGPAAAAVQHDLPARRGARHGRAGRRPRRMLLLPDLLGLLAHRRGRRRAHQRLDDRPLRRHARGTWSRRAGRAARPAVVDPARAARPGRRRRPAAGRGGGRTLGVAPDVPVIAVGSHDTASRGGRRTGRRRSRSPTSPRAPGRWSGSSSTRRCSPRTRGSPNFTNEGGVDGTIRFLKNVMGLWVLSESLRTWADQRASPASTCRRCWPARPRRPRCARSSTSTTRGLLPPQETCRPGSSSSPSEAGEPVPAHAGRDHPLHRRQPGARLPPQHPAGRGRSPGATSTSCTWSAAARRTRCCASSPPTHSALPVLAGPAEAAALGQRAGAGPRARRRPARPRRDARADPAHPRRTPLRAAPRSSTGTRRSRA